MIKDHIVEFTEAGWSVNHPLWCGSDLLQCPITQLARQTRPLAAVGRHWAWEEAGELVLGDPVPREVQGTSRRTSYRWP